MMAKVLLFVIEDLAGPGIRCLASYLRDHGHQPCLVFVGRMTLHFWGKIPDDAGDISEYKNSFAGFNLFMFAREGNEVPVLPDSFLKFCERERPDILGFSTRFCEERFRGFFSALRRAAPDALLIAGGHGPSVHTDEFLDMDLDCVVRGEGEEALLELANALDAGKNYKHIPNLAYRDEQGRTVTNRMRELLDLKKLPLPFWDNANTFHVENNIVCQGMTKKYSVYNYSMLAGRGCIGSCSYCAASLWRGIYIDQGSIAPKHRRRPNNQLIEEALQLKAMGAPGILFHDDYFIRPYEEMVDFFDQWKEKVGLPVYVHLSVEQLKRHPDILQRAIDAGLSTLLLAQQTADEKFAAEIFHRINDNAAILKFFRQAAGQYVQIQASFIDGYRIEGRDDLEAKLDFLRQMPFDPAFYHGSLISVMQLRIHPGSELSQTWPTYKATFLPPREFLYRAMLMHFRLIMDDGEFDRLRANTRLRDAPEGMLEMFHACLWNKQARYVLDSIKKLRDRDIYFFGCGQLYQACKGLFTRCRPKAILVDEPVDELIVDGLPVIRLEDALAPPGEERLPIVIFTSQAQVVARKIKKLRPDYTRDEIIACERNPFADTIA